MHGVRVREATAADDAALDTIAREGDAAAGPEYLELVRSQRATLLVAELGDAPQRSVAGFGGVVPVGDVLMLTDLFVAGHARGRGIGGELLAHLFGEHPHRMTFSSKHAAALPAYRRAGMQPRWNLLYLVGRGTADADAAIVAARMWRHERLDLVDAWARQGAQVSPDVVTMVGGDGMRIARLQSGDPVTVLHDALGAASRETVVRLCAPDHSPVAAASLALGFVVEDHDIWCASPGVELPADLHVLDPGLA